MPNLQGYRITLSGAELLALPSGALWWDETQTLVVSDLHLGKSERLARRGAAQLPPYETHDTLSRLDADLTATGVKTVICLGDSFDDLAAAQHLSATEKLWITRLQAGLNWIWITGNHDPGPLDLGGTYLAELEINPLIFRHETQRNSTGEISGHFHPKAYITLKNRSLSRPCFLADANRIILPAYGTYTGGLATDTDILSNIMAPNSIAILTGKTATAIPMPRK